MPKMRWDKADGRMLDLTRLSDGLGSDRPERHSRAVNDLSREELRRRSEQHEIHQAKIRILQRVARGVPINVFERRLIEGELPPGL